MLSLVLLWFAGCAGPVKQDAWQGAPDFPWIEDGTPGYEGIRIGGFGGDASDHTPRLDGAPIDHVFVFVHGNSSDSSVFDAYREAFLARGYNRSALWAPDWCGQGYQPWWDILTAQNTEDLRRFIEAVAAYTGTDEIRLVAHSQGGLLVKDLLYAHRPAGVRLSRISLVAVPNGDKTSGRDAGAAACLFQANRDLALCASELGESPAARAWRDDRVIRDPEIEALQAVYAGSPADRRLYSVDAHGIVADVRWAARDNLHAASWNGTIELVQRPDQGHRQLLDDNIPAVLAFITGDFTGTGQRPDDPPDPAPDPHPAATAY